jgi:hypothetical protein
VCAYALRQLCQGIPRPALEQVQPALRVLVMLGRQSGDEDVLQNVAWALESFVGSLRGEALGDTDSLQAAVDAGAVAVLLEMATHASGEVSHPALNALLHVARAGAVHERSLVQAGVLPRLRQCLAGEPTESMLACDVLANLASRGHVQALLEHGLFAALFALMQSAKSTAETSHAAYVVWRGVLEADAGEGPVCVRASAVW